MIFITIIYTYYFLIQCFMDALYPIRQNLKIFIMTYITTKIRSK